MWFIDVDATTNASHPPLLFDLNPLRCPGRTRTTPIGPLEVRALFMLMLAIQMIYPETIY